MELSDNPGDPNIDSTTQAARSRAIPWTFLYTFPWWGLALVLIAVWLTFSIAANDVYSNIFRQLKEGVVVTIRVAAVSYALAFLIGLTLGIIRSRLPIRRYGYFGTITSILQIIIYNVATFIVVVMRGLPILIVLLIFSFIIVPAVRDYLETNYNIILGFRSSSAESAIIALSFAYGAFLSETFRAGIQSVDKGQIEAARSLGMTYIQSMRHIVLPQAIRRVLPPLGNDFVSMIKDSSLVAYLGVNDITQIAKISSGSSFRYIETYITAALLYLSMTIIGTLLVRYLERQGRSER